MLTLYCILARGTQIWFRYRRRQCLKQVINWSKTLHGQTNQWNKTFSYAYHSPEVYTPLKFNPLKSSESNNHHSMLTKNLKKEKREQTKQKDVYYHQIIFQWTTCCLAVPICLAKIANQSIIRHLQASLDRTEISNYFNHPSWALLLQCNIVREDEKWKKILAIMKTWDGHNHYTVIINPALWVLLP